MTNTKETSEEARSKNDPTVCNKLTDSDRTECFVTYATEKNDPNACFKMNGSDEDCVAEYAIRKRTMTTCDLLTDPVKKYACVAKFTGDSTGRSLETIIGDWKTNGLVSNCLKQCENEAFKCRAGCIEAEKTDKSDQSWFKKQKCLDDCNQVQWYTCEPPCNAQAESK